MIGTAIKKYAEKHGMTCDGGYAYGRVHGRHIALEDGSGTKTLQIYLYPPAQSAEECHIPAGEVQRMLLDCNAKEYRLMKQDPVTVAGGRAVVVFHDNPGTMTCIERYIDEILPRLDALELNTDVCAYCGEALEGETRYVLLDDYVLPVHDGCVHEMTQQVDAQEPESKSGSVARGAIGALLGAVLGAIPWAVVFMLGYVTSLVGFLIGFLSNWMYGKLGGRNCKLRIVVVVLALILGVTLGQVAGNTAGFCQAFEGSGGLETVGLTRAQYVQSCWESWLLSDQDEMLGNMYDRIVSNIPENEHDQLITREEYIRRAWTDDYDAYRLEAQREFATNLGMGIIFGLLGCASLFVRLFKGTRRRSVKPLK